MILPATLPKRINNDKIDAAKGILILLVIFGHASNFWSPEPFATFSIKFFHVACFLLLPFIYDIKPFSLTYARDRMARYYIPFAIFTCIYAALYSAFITKNFDPLPLLQALTIANAEQLDAVTGLRALWFIPALITIVILNAALTTRLPIKILAPIALTMHLSAIILANTLTLKHWLPFGLVSALYLFPIGLIIRLLATKIDQFKKHGIAFLFLCIASIIAAYMKGSIIKFPVIHLPDITPIIALHPIIIITAFMFLITTPWFQNMRPLKWLGQNSLLLYLTHLPFMAAANITAQKFIDPSIINTASTAAVIVITTIALSGSIACAIIVNKSSTLQSLITPRDWQSWLPVKALNK